MAGIFIRREVTETQGEMHETAKAQVGMITATSQRMPRIVNCV